MAKIRLVNAWDRGSADRGLIDESQVRAIEIEALVDTGATTLALPAEVVERLELTELRRRNVRLADGSIREVPYVGNLWIEILGRGMSCDALVLPRGATALIGQIPLEGLDLIVDPKSRDVAVNPASPDMPLYDLLRAG